jgi:hypothetical protein
MMEFKPLPSRLSGHLFITTKTSRERKWFHFLPEIKEAKRILSKCRGVDGSRTPSQAPSLYVA